MGDEGKGGQVVMIFMTWARTGFVDTTGRDVYGFGLWLELGSCFSLDGVEGWMTIPQQLKNAMTFYSLVLLVDFFILGIESTVQQLDPLNNRNKHRSRHQPIDRQLGRAV